MKKIEAIIFDMDGVLIDSERISFKSYQKILGEYGYEMDEEFYLKFIGRNTKAIKEIIVEGYGPEFPVDVIYEKKSKLATETVDKNGVIIKPGVHELLDYLNNEKYKIAVATSTRRERALQLLQNANIKSKVDYVICGDQVKNSKPDPEIFLRAAEGLNVNPENCIVIEDSDAGIKAAHAAKMTGIHVPDMKSLDEENRKLAAMVHDNLLSVKEFFEKTLY